jgi:glycosyltransferase involved in cell wall biosynthesis
MQPRRVLIVLPDPPLPFGNAASRWFYVLCRGLVERGREVTIFAACRTDDEKQEALKLFSKREYDLRCYAHPVRKGVRSKWETWHRPYSYVFSERLQHDLEVEIARSCDVLHIEQLWSGWLGLAHADMALLNVHFSPGIDLKEEVTSSVSRVLLQMQSLRAEKRILRSYPVISTLTPRLEQHVRTINPEAVVKAIPLALDLSRYPFTAEPSCEVSPVVSLIGSFNWGPTYSAGVRLLTRLWPEIKRRLPEAQLQIVGREARKALQTFVTGPDVAIHENVPDTVPYFQRTGVLLFPAKSASGMKVKVLEAMALGTPVVTTKEGVEGLPAHDGIHAAICDDDEGLIGRTITLLNPSVHRMRLRQAARALIEKHCSPRPTVDAVESVHELIAERQLAQIS